MKTTKTKEKKVKKETKSAGWSEEALNQAKVRLSVYGKIFPESLPNHWDEFPGVGWVHESEHSTFLANFKQCFYNKKWYSFNDLSLSVEGYTISKEEVKSGGWVKCEHSDFWALPDNMIEAWSGYKRLMIAKRFIDTGDYFTCTLSGRVYQRRSAIQVRGSDRYTIVAREEVIRSELIKECKSCCHFQEAHNIFPRDIPEDAGIMMCNQCYAKHVARGLIRPHNFAEYPAPIHKKVDYWRGFNYGTTRRFKKVEDIGIRLFGVEVETEMSKVACRSRGIDRFTLAKSVKDTLGSDFVILKEDGSLSLNGHYSDGREGSKYAGFEIVSAPSDIEVHRQRWGLMEQMKNFDVLRAWDTETCGLHVHVSKDALTTLQIGRILMLMTHNNNKKFIAKVAGRGENKYCKAYHKERLADGIQYGEAVVRNGVEYLEASFSLPRSDEARRQAVNITNPKTIEFRIFRGTVHPRHIIRNIEFADAVCSFCHPGSRSLTELGDYMNLVHYIAENRKAYPLLTEWMESPSVGILPYRDKAYGPKDTRGTKRPDVIETLEVFRQKDDVKEEEFLNVVPPMRFRVVPARNLEGQLRYIPDDNDWLNPQAAENPALAANLAGIAYNPLWVAAGQQAPIPPHLPLEPEPNVRLDQEPPVPEPEEDDDDDDAERHW